MKKVNGLDCILLVDDDAITNLIHKRVIESMGLDVAVRMVSNGMEALDYLSREDADDFVRPGLILLDINMPEVNGWEFLERYTKFPEEKKAVAVVVMLTTSMQNGDKELAEQNPHIAAYVNKTLTRERLLAIIEQHFGE